MDFFFLFGWIAFVKNELKIALSGSFSFFFGQESEIFFLSYETLCLIINISQ